MNEFCVDHLIIVFVNMMLSLVLITVRISATLPVKNSSCVHCVMRGVTSGTIETLVVLHTYCSCLIMVAQFSLLLSCPFGVSS